MGASDSCGRVFLAAQPVACKAHRLAWWMALMAPALGALAAGFRLRKIPLGLALVLGAGAWVWVWRGRPDLSLWGGLGATCGLFALGYGVSAALGLGRMGWAGLALLTWALIGAPAGYWLPDVAPWSPKVTAAYYSGVRRLWPSSPQEGIFCVCRLYMSPLERTPWGPACGSHGEALRAGGPCGGMSCGPNGSLSPPRGQISQRTFRWLLKSSFALSPRK